MKSPLGKGLASLLKEEVTPVNRKKDIENIDIQLIIPDANQPRKYFDPEKIKELTYSIKEHGIIQPIIVNKIQGSDKYKIIAGERRFRAATNANLNKIPVIIKDIDENKVLEIALVENIQRDDLNVVEEAEGFAKLIEKFGYTHELLGSTVGKSRAHISNILRINNLPQEVKQMLIDKQITFGHAKSIANSKYVVELARLIIEHSLNVRETEELAKNFKEEYQDRDLLLNNLLHKREFKQITPVPQIEYPLENTDVIYDTNKHEPQNKLDQDIQNICNYLQEKLKISVQIQHKKNNRGKLVVFYDSLEDLDRILNIIN